MVSDKRVAAPSDAASQKAGSRGVKVARSLGLGLITGAADDDPSAVGTYASAGAAFGYSFLWAAPVMFPLMFAVVYLSGKLGQVSGQGLFQVIRQNYPRWILYPTLIGGLIGNTIEAGADMGGMAAAMNLLVPIPITAFVVGTALVILALQIWGSYVLIRNTFRWLALALLAYIGSALLAKPDLFQAIKGTLVPRIEFSSDFLSMLVAIIGASCSAYLYTWQSNEEVEEEIAMGRIYLWQRKGATDEELRRSRRDILIGIFFSNVVVYFIMLSTAATLHKAGQTEINSAAEAAEALRPLAGDAAGSLFALGVVAVGFLAVPIMTIGAAYDLAQSVGWEYGLYTRLSQAKKFYLATIGFTAAAVAMNFLGINPMKALVWAGIVQGFSTPPLMLLIMLMTNDPKIMGDRVNGRVVNVLGWITMAAIFAASIGLVITWTM